MSLVAEDVTKRYGGRAALSGVSFAARPGERVAVIGPNGAGKTTLLSVLAGLVAPTSGRIDAAGAAVGWVPQQPAVYRKLSVAENLRLFARLERVPDVGAAVDEALARTGLADRAGDELGALSGGNQQRVNVAIGLLGRPAVLLLDEPSTALDPRQRERLFAVVDALAADGTTVVWTTHLVDEAERHADRVLVLADGQLLFAGPPADLRHGDGGAPDLEAAFVGLLERHGH
jgi:ABC-2 type transport system ATP-binding protein